MISFITLLVLCFIKSDSKKTYENNTYKPPYNKAKTVIGKLQVIIGRCI